MAAGNMFADDDIDKGAWGRCLGHRGHVTHAADDYRQWLHRLGPAMALFVRQWVPTHADAEDVVQEAFVRFWAAGREVREPQAYLFATVRRCALNWHRAQSRRRRREQAAGQREANASEPLFEGSLEQQEQRRRIERAMENLPGEQREVVVLKIWGGLTFEQIGEALDVSPNTAASRYRYALKALRPLLAEEGVT